MSYFFSLITCILVFFCSAFVDAASWWSLDDSRYFPDASGKMVKTIVLTIDLNKAQMRIVSVPFEAAAVSERLSQLSLRDFSEMLIRHKNYKNKDWIAVNGGFSSSTPDSPLGLLVIDRKVYSTLSKEKTRATSAELSEFSQFRWPGILCQQELNNNWDIIPASKYIPTSCRNGLQAGPVPVEPNSKAAISSSEINNKSAYTRTAVCLSDEFQMRVILTLDKTHLFPLSKWLSEPESSGGLGCRVALNLSGDSCSGIAIKSPATTPVRFLGEGSFPIPTALVFESK